MKTTHAARVASASRFAMCAVLLVTGVTAHSMPGSGTPEDPYLISSCQDLSDIRDNPSAHYKLASDVDCSVAPFNEGEGFVPIFAFSGTLDGDYHSVRELYINTPGSWAGLFYGFPVAGTFLRLGLENVNITGSDYTGALLANANVTEGATVRECWSTGSVRGNGDGVGGLAGSFLGTMIDSYSSASVHGSSAGGLVGRLWATSEVVRSYSTGPVDCWWRCGGLVGAAEHGGSLPYGPIIKDSFSTGSVSGSDKGGLIGWAYDAYNPEWIFAVNSFFDVFRSGIDWCQTNAWLGPISPPGCTGVNAVNGTPEYWFVTANPPMNSWTFPPWIARPGDYPVLRDDDSLNLADLELSKPIIVGCKSLTAKVTLSKAAPTEGVVITLSDTLASASTPATLKILAGSTTKFFTVKTLPVESEETGTVSATLGSQTLSQSLAVRAMGLYSMTLTPTSVVGSQPVVGKATLECNAGPGPITVDLSSNNSGVAYPVAASVVVPQGLRSASFDVATNPVQAKSYATIAGTANGITKSKKLTVNVAASVSPTSLKFGSVVVGTTSAPLNATLTNKGATAFSVNGINLTGTSAAWFAQTNDCPATLAAGASCAISVTFTPLSAASKSAKVSIATSATATPLSVSLSGTGVLPP